MAPLLGLGDDQDVSEQEKVPVLCLHPCLELDVSMEEKVAARVNEEGLDKRSLLRVETWQRETLSAKSHTRSIKKKKDDCEFIKLILSIVCQILENYTFWYHYGVWQENE